VSGTWGIKFVWGSPTLPRLDSQTWFGYLNANL